ncbi:putative inorganic phosphate transporter 1-12 [Morella rubra]|uniref:Putative inorganic phosphate transporter 1-12 n=1 Tax=Morella rubra TaxID=262757 RepID=A0A6A1UI04_9ROSI|nr:putative inorganic phosphate transporter 1-12 [Morella rubra]
MALKVLSALDSARTQLYHFKAIVIAGMGLFTDSYDLFCIPPIMTLIGRVYYENESEEQKYQIPPAVVSTMVAIALLGTATGQLVFGRLGDIVGRRRMYGLSLLIMVLSSVGCGFSICTTRSCVLFSLGLFRFVLGLGIGGDYPLSATIMSEFANKRTRGAFIAAVFSMQGLGILAASTVTMVVCAIFNRVSHLSAKDPTPKEADVAWRLILMLGAVPAAITFYWRMKMPETARYTALVAQNVFQAAKDMEKVLEVSMDEIAEESPLPPLPPVFRRHWTRPQCSDRQPYEDTFQVAVPLFQWGSRSDVNRQLLYTALVAQNVFQAAKDMEKVLEVSIDEIAEESPLPPLPPAYPLFSKKFFRRHGVDLFACSCTWFLLDVVFYSSNLFQSRIYDHYLPKKAVVNAYEDTFQVAKLQAIIAACSTIPGYWFTVFFIDRIGRVAIQVMGFLVMSMIYLAIAIPYYAHWDNNPNAGFIILYGLTFFFANFGPNTTTFIVPAELFPARFRSTCHGIAGAAGKLGAIIGSVGFFWASHKRKENGYPKGLGMPASLIILSGVCLVGMAVTLLFTRETKGRSLEENENDDEPNQRCFGCCLMGARHVQSHSSPEEADVA